MKRYGTPRICAPALALGEADGVDCHNDPTTVCAMVTGGIRRVTGECRSVLYSDSEGQNEGIIGDHDAPARSTSRKRPKQKKLPGISAI